MENELINELTLISKFKKLYLVGRKLPQYTQLPIVNFDNRPVKSQICKHLGMMLDSNLSYEHHIKSILDKVNH